MMLGFLACARASAAASVNTDTARAATPTHRTQRLVWIVVFIPCLLFLVAPALVVIHWFLDKKQRKSRLAVLNWIGLFVVGPSLNLWAQGSKGKIRFQSSFMLNTVQP